MWNGFYHIELDAEKLKQFYVEALEVADKSYVDFKPTGKFRRERCEMTPMEYIENRLGITTHNIVVNRFEYNGCETWADKVAEIGSSTMSNDSYYLYLIMSVEKLNKLVEKWALTKKEI